MKKPKRSTLIRKLDRIFSEYIRKRDTNHKGQVECISCQKTFQYKEVDAGHFISRKYLRTRWDEKMYTDNVGVVIGLLMVNNIFIV